MMRKIIILASVFIVSFLGGYGLHKVVVKKEPAKSITMAGLRQLRLQAIQKALAEGKKEYEFEVGYIVPLSE